MKAKTKLPKVAHVKTETQRNASWYQEGYITTYYEKLTIGINHTQNKVPICATKCLTRVREDVCVLPPHPKKPNK